MTGLIGGPPPPRRTSSEAGPSHVLNPTPPAARNCRPISPLGTPVKEPPSRVWNASMVWLECV